MKVIMKPHHTAQMMMKITTFYQIFRGCIDPGLVRQGSHRSGKSGNSGKILKTFSSQGNQGKNRVFQPKSGKKISKSGNFFSKPFPTFLNL